MHTGAPRKRGEVRERVLQLAESAILEKGFGATSIEELIAAAGITKSGFFYHFKDKTELARILLTSYIEREDALFDDLFRRADELNEDPLHGFLVGLKMLDQQVRDLNTSAVLAWRKRFRQRLDEIAALYPPKIAVDLDDLADMLSVIADGGIILSKVLKDRDALPRQVMLYREFVRSVFLRGYNS